MKIAKFTYTDTKGKTKERQVLVISEPSDKLKGIEVSELPEQDAKAFSEAYSAAQDAFHANIEALKAEYDMKHNFRQFFASKIEAMTVEQI